MREQNMIDFETMSRKVFDYLLLSFPLPADLGPGSLNLPHTGGGTHQDGEWKPVEFTKEEKLFYATVRWLYESGFVYGRVTESGTIREIVLTEKGLETQNAYPRLRPAHQHRKNRNAQEGDS